MSDNAQYAGRAAVTQDTGPQGISLGGLLGSLWRHRLWIVFPVLVLTALAVLWLSSVTPLYRSTAKIIVENQENAFTRPSTTVEERALLDQEAVKSQVQLILSADLSRKVIAELGLAKLPEFNPASGGIVSSVLSLLGFTRDPARLSGDQRVLDRFYERLTVYQIDTSRVIAIEFSSQNPELAARIANAVADSYIEMQRSAKRDATREAGGWLEGQIQSLRASVDAAERRVEDFRAEHGLFASLRGSADPQTLSQQQLTELTTQLALVRAQKSEAQAKARMIREMIDTGRPVEASEVLNSGLIQNLVTQQVTLTAQVAELSSTLGPRHPRMKELNAQLADLRRLIRDEAARYVRAAENDASIAAEREEVLMGTLETLKDNVVASGDDEVQLRALEREAKSQRDLLESMLARYGEASARDDIASLPADARIVSRASPASSPYFPKAMSTLLAVFLGSLVLSCGVLVTLELARAVAEAPQEGVVLAGTSPYPRVEPSAVSVVPERADPVPVEPAASIPIDPLPVETVSEPGETEPLPSEARLASPVDPRVAAIAAAIVKRTDGDLAETVLVTSVRRSTGAGDTAMQVGRAVSGAGSRVVVVDTQFEETAIGSGAGPLDDRAPGLGELLAGRADFETAIRRDAASRVHVIPAGIATADPLLLVASERMETVLAALRLTYDVVILLAPAVSRRGEARLLARRSGFAVLVTSAAVDDPATKRARERLEDAGVRDIEILQVTNGEGDDSRQSAA